MKKIILIATSAFIAQTASAQLTIAPELGFQMSKVVVKPSESNDFKPSFRLGANFDMGLTDNIHLQFGAFYSGKGAKESANGATAKLGLNYLEVPVYVNYMTGKAGGNRFFAGVGPYFGYCLGGTLKVSGFDDAKLKVGSDAANDDIKPLDLGINLNAGYLLSNNIYVRAQYGMGLMNNVPGGNSDASRKNAGFAISFGYNFGL